MMSRRAFLSRVEELGDLGVMLVHELPRCDFLSVGVDDFCIVCDQTSGVIGANTATPHRDRVNRVSRKRQQGKRRMRPAAMNVKNNKNYV